LAALVWELNSSALLEKAGAYDLKEILAQFPSLRSLVMHHVEPLSLVHVRFLPSLLPPLVSLSYSCTELVFADIDVLSRFSQLKRLEIRFILCSSDQPTTFSSPVYGIEQLSLSRGGNAQQQPGTRTPWSAHCALFVDQFPQLQRLELFDCAFDRYGDLLIHLGPATSTLRSLVLKETNKNRDQEQSTLPRFQHLEHLDMAGGTFTASLIHLRRLPLLTSLRVWSSPSRGAPKMSDLLDLVRGEHRLARLKLLVVDSYVGGKVGVRVDVCDQGGVRNELLDGGQSGWSGVEFHRDRRWNLAAITELVKSGNENGVEVKGSVVDSLPFRNAVLLEKANRLILRAYESKSFVEYVQTRESENEHRLPNIDPDKLDPKRLKVVKIELPEEDWFQLTLENDIVAEGEAEDGAEEERVTTD
jgi:hypothetical protein